jgi:two-component system, OmpR family, sensor histidine kinase MprB
MELNWASHPRRGGDPDPVDPQPAWPVGTPSVVPSPPWSDRRADLAGPAPGPDEQAEPAEQPAEPAEQPQPRLAWLRQISFRSRISVLVGMAVGIAVALAALVSYVAVSRQMEQQATSDVQNAAGELPELRGDLAGGIINSNPFIGFELRTLDQVQLILGTGDGGMQTYAVQAKQENIAQITFFKITPAAKQTFSSPPGTESVQSLVGADGNPYRVATVSVITGSLAVQVGYPLSSMDDTLASLRLILVLVALGGVALAAGLGWAVGRASMRPVEELTLAAEHVAETQDLSATIDDTGKDELARLARSFNAMLGALDASKSQQAQLVSDAGHELRTPLTSLRTNIEVLMRNKALAGTDREELLADVDAQLTELTTLVGDLVDLAREDERPQAEPEPVNLNEIVERAVERAQRRALSVHFDVSLQSGPVLAQSPLLERAVMNVLDNAAKWSPPGGHVGVTLVSNSAWHLTVTDQGPGISDRDLPHIFERFYRAPSARSMPGSGLGLSIVKRVVTSHGGSVDVTPRPEGGTEVDIVLPLTEDGNINEEGDL